MSESRPNPGPDERFPSHPGAQDGASPTDDDLVDPEADDHVKPTSKVPLIVMGVMLALLLATGGVVGYLFTERNRPPVPTATAEPTGMPELPVTAGDLTRPPGEPQSTSEAASPGSDTGRQIVTATYYENDQPAYIVIAARPVADKQVLLEEQLQARGIRPLGNAVCGRESRDLDVCAVNRSYTVLLVIGQRSQKPEEIVAAAEVLLENTK